jgi:hypothetical protein
MFMRKTLRLLTILVMFGFFGTSFAQDVEIPGNYIQNPNFEHTMNPIFWYGSWDWVHWNNSVAWLPEFWITDTTEVHSGKQCMVITEDSWVWPTVTTVGFEEKDMKMSFWYKSPVEMMAFWMFFYRDAELTREEIRAPIPAGYVGYDTAYVATQLTGDVEIDQSLYFEMWGPYPDWTYFEFTFSYPGTIPNPWVTLMFWSQYTPGFVDDVYYGLDFDGVYNGEESVELKNPDFEDATLGLDWLVNSFGGEVQILNEDENHTPNGFQSIANWADWNTTYYMPAGGTEGDDMWMSFWHKGHSGSIDLYFYQDYGITKDDFPVPDGAEIILDSIAIYDIDTIEIIVDTVDMSVDTMQVGDPGDLDILEMVIDTSTTVPVEVLAFQDFDTAAVPTPLDWLWSDSYLYGDWGDWTAGVKEIDAYSSPKSLWLPGDPLWTGVEGTISGIIDDTSYAWTFMYKGKLQFELRLGSGMGYDLMTDPEGIVPPDASVTDDGLAIHWDLDSDWWRKFSFVYDQGSWLADASLATDTCKFTLVSAKDTLDVGFVDDIEVYIARDTVPPIVDTSYIVVDTAYTIETTYVTDTISVEWDVDQLGVSWPLPAASEWTQFDFRWTNPTGDIGSTLTMTLHADEKTETDSLIYFDDFIYGEVATSVRDVQTTKALHLYPNPVTDMVYLSIEEPLARIDVYNTVGQLVKSLNNPERKVNMSDLRSGMYLMKVADQKGRHYESKFIKK